MTKYEKKIIEIMAQKGVDRMTTTTSAYLMNTEERQKLLLRFVEEEEELTKDKVISEVVRILMNTTAPGETYLTED